MINKFTRYKQVHKTNVINLNNFHTITMSRFSSFGNGTSSSGQPLTQNRAPSNQPISHGLPRRASPAQTWSSNNLRNQNSFLHKRRQQSLASKFSAFKRQN